MERFGTPINAVLHPRGQDDPPPQRGCIMNDNFGWLDVQRIGEDLADRHPGVDPYSVNFLELKKTRHRVAGFHTRRRASGQRTHFGRNPAHLGR
jgi:FeS assembly protein IscX